MSETGPESETPWGFMEDGVFVVLPKGPMKHLGPPPFDVVLWNDTMRHVIEQPA